MAIQQSSSATGLSLFVSLYPSSKDMESIWLQSQEVWTFPLLVWGCHTGGQAPDTTLLKLLTPAQTKFALKQKVGRKHLPLTLLLHVNRLAFTGTCQPHSKTSLMR